MNSSDAVRNDWSREEIQALYQQPLMDLVFQAQQVHREHFTANTVQVSTLLSIKTGKCPEDCKYCSQSAHYDSKLEAEKRIAVDKVIQEAKQALASGSSRLNHNDDKHPNNFHVQERVLLPKQFHFYFHLNAYAHTHLGIQL